MTAIVQSKDRVRDLQFAIRNEFSRYAYISSLDEKKKEGKVGLQIREVIPDYKSDSTSIRVIPLNDIATFQWRESTFGVRITKLTRTNFVKEVKEQYLTKVHKSQTILLPSVYTKLVDVSQVKVAMSPLRRILVEIDDNGSAKPGDLGFGARKDSRVSKYFGLLADLEFVESENSHYVAGPKMRNLQASEVEPSDLFRQILAEVIRKKSKYLKEVLHWTMMVPYLHWCNTYYFPAYEAGHLVKTEQQDLIRNYRRFYQTKHPQSVAKDQVLQVVDAHLLKREEKRFYEGMPQVFDEYAKGMDRENVLEVKSLYSN